VARKARLSDVVIVSAVIGEDGRVWQPHLLKGGGLGLDAMAAEAICSWQFKPATRGGEPVKVFYTVTVNFAVQNGWKP